MSPEAVISVRELDQRVCGRVQVRLLWSADVGRPWVTVLDIQTGEGFRIDVVGHESARDVFHHPFAYRGVRAALSPASSGVPRPAEVTG